ncbi:MAG: hypothetical protein BAJALOKI1v1_50005 [Promethearchaeota archaeon]|nr:MAG: hypothetical protein BAJALOKI1v1_50005 [Candidatus Lokiarchaeota archaeon]
MNLQDKKIYFIPSPHINYYHSYRGDSRGADGFGKDLKLMRGILDYIDEIEEMGLCGGKIKITWDYADTYWSIQLQKEYQSDVLDRVIERCKKGKDEVLIGSWGNVGQPFLDAEEFIANYEWLLENSMGIGLKQLFPGRVAPYIRAQETMFTQGMIELFNKCGIKGVCNYYSVYEFDVARPFLCPRLDANQRYGLVKFNSTISNASCLMIPMYAFGDILDYCSIKRWFKLIRTMQESDEIEGHALFFFNFDMDYENWLGVDLPKFLSWMPNTRGLLEFAEAVDEFEYVEFANLLNTIPKLKIHGETYLRQDIADGYWNGYYNWAQKYNNTKFWTIGQRARWLKCTCDTFTSKNIINMNKEIINEELRGQDDLSNSYLKNKILFASTTNFGLALPFQHPQRRKTAMKYGVNAYNSSKNALEYLINEFKNEVKKKGLEGKNILFIQPITTRGISERESTPVNAPLLIQYNINKHLFDILRENNTTIKIINPYSETKPIKYNISYNQSRDSYLMEAIIETSFFKNSTQFPAYLVIEGTNEKAFNNISQKRLKANTTLLENGSISVSINEKGIVEKVIYKGENYACPKFLESAISYGPMGKEKRYNADSQEVTVLKDGADGFSASLKLKCEFEIIPGKKILSEKILTLYDQLPSLFVEVEMKVPEIKGEATSEDGVEFVKEPFNENWKEIIPAEIKPNLFSNSENKYLRIWKRNFLGVVDYFDLNMKVVDELNANIDCLVSNITDGWMAVSDQEKGLMVGFNSLYAANFAFSPLKIRDKGFKDCGKNQQQIRMNPFGTYFGKSLHYWTCGSSHAQTLLPKMMRQKKSTAATFSGKKLSFHLVISPYIGDKPPLEKESFLDHFSLPPFLIISLKNGDLKHNASKYHVITNELIDEFDIKDILDISYLGWVKMINKDYDPSQELELPKQKMRLGLRCMLTLLIDGLKG